MFEFITIPLVVGIVCVGIYSLFELFVRKKERLSIIEKIGEKLDASAFEGKLSLPKYIIEKIGEKLDASAFEEKLSLSNYSMKRYSFSSLKISLFLTGIGLGMIVGFFIFHGLLYQVATGDYSLRHETGGIIYGACMLLFGGLGLFISFLIESHLIQKEKEKEKEKENL